MAKSYVFSKQSPRHVRPADAARGSVHRAPAGPVEHVAQRHRPTGARCRQHDDLTAIRYGPPCSHAVDAVGWAQIGRYQDVVRVRIRPPHVDQPCVPVRPTELHQGVELNLDVFMHDAPTTWGAAATASTSAITFRCHGKN